MRRVRGALTVDLQIHFCSRSRPPLAYGEQEQSEAGERERTHRVTHVESVIYFFIIKIREGRGERMARLI